MKTMNNRALVVLAVLVASALIVGGDKSTRADTGGPALRVLKGNYMTDATGNVEKRDLVITRLFDAPIELVWKAWTDPEYVMSTTDGKFVVIKGVARSLAATP